MIAINIALVFLSLGALLSFSSSEKCTTELCGNKTVNGHLLTKAMFPPDSRFQLVNIHPGCHAVGVLVEACDDVAPKLTVISVNEAQIDRVGTLKYPGYVHVVAYCPVSEHHVHEIPGKNNRTTTILPKKQGDKKVSTIDVFIKRPY